MTPTPESLAAELHEAWTSGEAIEPFTERGLITTVEEAYAVQRAWAEIRAAAGETTVGRKIGLTSDAMRTQMGVDEPDFGDLWGSRDFTSTARVPFDDLLQPRAEGELAFLMANDLVGPGVGEEEVRRATDGVALAFEVVDSRIRDWRIALADTIADNASYGGFVLGAWEPLAERDPAAIKLSLLRDGETALVAAGTSVMGSPLRSVAWLANRLGSFGIGIRAGDVVLSGAFGGALPVAAGDRYTVMADGFDPVNIDFPSVACQEAT